MPKKYTIQVISDEANPRSQLHIVGRAMCVCVSMQQTHKNKWKNRWNDSLPAKFRSFGAVYLNWKFQPGRQQPSIAFIQSFSENPRKFHYIITFAVQ